MLKLQVVKLGFKCLVLTCLASVVLLGQDALTACYTRREMAATIFAVDVTTHEIGYQLGKKSTYNSVILALQSFLGQLTSFIGLLTGGCLENRLIASIS